MGEQVGQMDIFIYLDCLVKKYLSGIFGYIIFGWGEVWCKSEKYLFGLSLKKKWGWGVHNRGIVIDVCVDTPF